MLMRVSMCLASPEDLSHRLTVQRLAWDYEWTEGRTKAKHMGVDANMFILIQYACKYAQPAGALHAELA